MLIAEESAEAATKLIDSYAKSFVLPKCQAQVLEQTQTRPENELELGAKTEAQDGAGAEAGRWN